METQKDFSGYTTENEMKFLSALGTGEYSESAKVKETPRREMLKKYLKAARNRKEWGNVDSGIVMAAVEGMIASTH